VLVGPSTRSAAESLARSTNFPITIDRFADQDNQQSASASHVVDSNADLVTTLGQYRKHTVIVCGTWPGILDAIVAAGCQFIPGRDTWESARHIDQLWRAAKASGLMIPQSTNTPPAEPNSKRFLIKHVAKSGGTGIQWYDPIEDAFESPSGCYYQQWIPGKAMGASFLACRDGIRLLGVCRNSFSRVGKFPFVHKGLLGPIAVPKNDHDRLLAAAQTVALESGLRGLFNIDFIRRTDGQLFLLEVNPRWTAASEIIERSLTAMGAIKPSESLMQLCIDAMRGEVVCPRFNPKTDRESFQWIKRTIFASQQTVFDLEMARDSARQLGRIHDLSKTGQTIQPSQPICTLIAKWSLENQSVIERSRWLKAYRKTISDIQSGA
jgi:predicted ATP-grasp superfamily ATP-dependent carboligase